MGACRLVLRSKRKGSDQGGAVNGTLRNRMGRNRHTLNVRPPGNRGPYAWSMKVRHRVWFARLRAYAWLAVGIASIPLGLESSVPLVWAASVYANVASELAAAQAADDRKVLDAIKELRADVAALRALIERQA
jgi:hypothetical protein